MTIRQALHLIARCALVAIISLSITACAHRPPESDADALAEYERINDPLEPLNRVTHDFNMAFDTVIMKPIAHIYRALVPGFMRRGISNVLDNLAAPFILANDLLQGEFERGGDTLARFAINTTVGVGGIFDPAAEWGIEKHKEDFGETLAVWGVGEGFYLVLPFLGPSNPRDFAGLMVEFVADPTSLYLDHEDLEEVGYARTALEVIDFRERNLETIDDLKANSTDFYAALRSAYRQNRAFRISNGRSSETKAEEELFETEMDEDF
ncbi:MAG: VacJ family lipoprotein [Alphaproteobacteria bacterium]|nr:MAG: VacJ family lipoprotein [Alphaproteobacteria bacterium]